MLDPIDGTKGFVTGEGYVIGLALLVDGEPIVGVMGCWEEGAALPLLCRACVFGLLGVLS